jgi:hypothetical protein
MAFTESIVENAAQRDALLSKPLSGELRVPEGFRQHGART